MRRPLPALAWVALIGIAGGCTLGGSEPTFEQPPESAFRAGACRGMAPDILAIGRDARNLGAGDAAPPPVAANLRAAQDRLRAVQPTLEPDVAPLVDDVVVAIGDVRLASVVNGLTASMATDLSAKYERLVGGCTD